MTEQTKKLTKTQLKRWKLALKEAAKINRKIKKNKNAILIDTSDYNIMNGKFELFTDKSTGVSDLGILHKRSLFSMGDNNPEYDNGIMYNILGEIRTSFNQYKVYGEV